MPNPSELVRAASRSRPAISTASVLVLLSGCKPTDRGHALMPSRPGEFHPEPLTDPDLILSHHPARATVRRLPPSVEYRVPPVSG